MTDAIVTDKPIQTQKSSPRKSKSYKSYKSPFWKKVSKIDKVPRADRERMLEEAAANPVWGADQRVQCVPVRAIMELKLKPSQKLILADVASSAPDFSYHHGTAAKHLDCCAKTAGKHMADLVKKGYLVRSMVTKPGLEKSFYEYTLAPNFLGLNGKNFPPKNILSGYTTPNLPAEAGEGESAAPTSDTPIHVSTARKVAEAAMRPMGTMEETVLEIQLDSRKVSAHQKKLKDVLLFEDTQKVIEEKKARTEKIPVSRSKKASAINWKTCKRSEKNALLWIEEHAEGKALAARLLDISADTEFSGPCARMLLRRWQSGEISMKKVVRLQHAAQGNCSSPSLRNLITKLGDLLKKHQAHIDNAHHMMAFRVDTYQNGDKSKLQIELSTAKRYLSNLVSLGKLTYDQVFTNSPAEIPRYALAYQLVLMGQQDMVVHHQHIRVSDIEDEMAKNLAVWAFWNRLYDLDPELFFYDSISARMLRNHEKIMLQQECMSMGSDMETVMQYLVRGKSSV